MAVGDTLRDSIFTRDGFACVYCTRTVASGAVLTVDHVTPQAWFASSGFNALGYEVDAARNLVACCGFCNSRKRDMDLEVYALYLRRRFGENTRAMVLRVHRQVRRSV